MDCSFKNEGSVWKLKSIRNSLAGENDVCSECNNPMPSGAKHLVIAGKCDDELITLKICLECDSDWKALMKLFTDHGFSNVQIVWGSIRKVIQDAFDIGILSADDDLFRRWISGLKSNS